jgi:alkylated DNA repair dioxygenase AlkB
MHATESPLLPSSRLERMTAVRGAECFHCPSAFADVAGECYELLRAELPWTQGSVRVYGKSYPERRLTCLLSDAPGESYHYSSKEMTGSDWHPVVSGIRERLQSLCAASYPGWQQGWRFDTCLCNYYRPRREILADEERPWKPDVISWHSDSEQDLVVDAPIASVSFGATRRFDLRPNARANSRRMAAPVQHEDVRTYLVSGSLFVMGRDTQRYYMHQVPEERTVEGGRVNLTFRMTKRS